MNNIFQSLTLLFFLGQVSHAQDTIPVDYETDFLIIENNVYRFFTAEGEALTPEFKTPDCYFPLEIDAETCYLRENEGFEAQVNGKWGLMTRQGEIKLPFEYDELLTSYDGRIFVRKKEKWTEIQRAAGGNRVFPIDCDYVAVDYQIGVLFVKGDSVLFSPERGVISEKPAKLPTHGYFEIRRGCKCGVGTADGKLLLPVSYRRIGISDEGITLSDGDKEGFYHPETQKMIPLKYDDIDDGSNDGLLIYGMGSKKRVDARDWRSFNPTDLSKFICLG